MWHVEAQRIVMRSCSRPYNVQEASASSVPGKKKKTKLPELSRPEALESQIMLGDSLLVHGIAKPSSEQSEARYVDSVRLELEV